MKILKAKLGHIFRNKNTGQCSEKIYLPNNGNIDKYEEIPKDGVDIELYDTVEKITEENKELKKDNEKLNQSDIELKESNSQQNELLDISMLAMDEMFTLFEPLLLEVMSVDEVKEVNPLVELYVVMIQRGLKTIDQVPARYREQVRAILEAVEE